jgi:hypothetical protein
MLLLRLTEIFSHEEDETSQSDGDDWKSGTPDTPAFCRRLKTWMPICAECARICAEWAKIIIQWVLGIGVFLFVIGYGASNLYVAWRGESGLLADGWTRFAQISFLKIVGEILAMSAAVDLAYMLFTEGPDEAVQPLIVGIAAAVLISVSEFKHLVTDGKPDLNLILLVGSILLLISAIAALFYIDKKYIDSNESRAD